MAAQAGTRIKGLEAERLGGGGFDDFPDVHAHTQAEQFELVHQGNVDATVNIFQQLGHFRSRGSRNLDDAIENGTVERRAEFRSFGLETAYNFGYFPASDGIVAGILALRRERYIKVTIGCLSPACF